VLRKLTIAGFKSIRKQEIDLGRLNVFIGQNGAGKSNVLEAIGMLSAALDGALTHATLRARGVRQSTPSVYRSALRQTHRPKYFDLLAEFDSVRYHCNIYTTDNRAKHEEAWTFHSESFWTKAEKWHKAAGRSAHGVRVAGRSLEKARLKPSQSLYSAVELLGDLSDEQIEELSRLREFAIYAPTTGVLRGEDSDSNPKDPLGLAGGGLADALKDVADNPTTRKELLRFFRMLSWFKSFSIQEPLSELKPAHLAGKGRVISFSDQFMTQDFNKLYSYDVSEGALYVCFMLTLLTHPKSPRILALDNVDSTLNPGLVRSMIVHIGQIAKRFDRQVLITTHNPTALDGLDLFNPDHRLYLVDRAESGETELRRLQPTMPKSEWDEKFGGTNLSELWVDGLLGGVAPVI
jgi:predicted ATPase